VITEGNPLTDIKDAAAVRYVVKNGEAFDIPTLVAPFEGKTYADLETVSPVRTAQLDQHWWHSAEYVEDGRAACCVDPLCRPLTKGARRTFTAIEV